MIAFLLHSTAAGTIVAEEVVVESSLNIRSPAKPVRRVREVLYYLLPNEPSAPVFRYNNK